MAATNAAAKKLIVRAAGESRVGHARGNNEDNIYFNGDFITPRNIRQPFAVKTGEEIDVNCFAVLDGMGRNNTGSFASLLAATRLDEVLDRVSFDTANSPDSAVLDYVHNANIEIREQIKETGGVRTASTMALLIIENGMAHVYNAGDSRVYLFRDRQLIRLTRDHVSARGQKSITLTEEGVRNGGLTKYLGMPESDGELEPYRAKPFKLHKGDKLLLCSDGISDYLDDETIAECLSKRKDPFGHTNELIDMALAENSADNVSAIVVEAVDAGLNVTTNMIFGAVCAMVMLVSLIFGGLLGFIVGKGSAENIVTFYDYTPSDNDYSYTTMQTAPPEFFVSGSDMDTTAIDITEHPTTTYPTTTTTAYPAESFTIDNKEFTLKVGQQYTFGVVIYPIEAGIPKEAIHWESSDPAVATVSSDGVVTAVSRGSVTITATILGNTEEENIIQTAKVYVRRS